MIRSYTNKVILILIALIAIIAIDFLFFRNLPIKKVKNQLERIIHQKEQEALDVINSNKFLSNYTDINYLNKLKTKLENEQLYLYIYNKNNLEYWSNNTIVIKNPKIIYESNEHFVKQGNTYFVAIHQFLPDLNHQLLVLIPIFNQYFINNKYLISGFVFDENFKHKISISNKNSSEKKSVYNAQHKFLFSIKPNINENNTSSVILITYIFLIILLSYVIKQIVIITLNNKKYLWSLLWIVLFIFITELFLNQTIKIIHLPNSLLFSPTLYASKFLGQNLIQLFVRVCIIVWLFSFFKHINFNIKHQEPFLILPILHFYIIVYIITNIIENSTINFNLFSYTSVNKYSYLCLILFGILFFSLLQLLNRIFIHPKTIKEFYIILLGILFISIVIYFYSQNIYYTFFLALWISSFILIFYVKKEIQTKYYFITSLLIIAFISFLCLSITTIKSEAKEFEIKKKRIRELYAERNLIEEFDLSNIETKIYDDKFIAKYLGNPYLLNIALPERIQKYLTKFNKNYIINSYAFDFSKNPIKGIENKAAYYFDKSIASRKSKKISSHFYYVPIKESGEKYIGKFRYQEDTSITGFLYIELIPRIYKANSAYLDLLSKNRNYFDDVFRNYSYAIYQNNNLIKHSGTFQYATYFNLLDTITREYHQVDYSKFSHTIYKHLDKVIVVSAPNESFWLALSLFSTIFLLYLILFIMLDILGFSYDLWIDTKIKDFFVSNTLQKQIQNYSILLLFISLTILALITFIYFNFQYKKIYYEKLQQNTNVVVKSFKQLFNEYYSMYNEETYNWVIQNKLQQRSDIFEVDIAAYNTNGDLINSSNPEIYKKELISNKMNPNAYYELHYLKKSKFINDEKIGKLNYLSLYLPITIDGKTKLYFQFPYYNLDKYLKEEIILFLISLINIYVIFLIIVAISAVFLSKKITNSLVLIADHIKNVQLNKKNTPLNWNRNDEIAVLVTQYNLMLAQLEKSALLLAKSERESAWSEMAKQVAHEIKNPLTPMKLSIQHLQRAIDNNEPDIKQITQKIALRLIEQIDSLSDIANAFSDFAKLSYGKNEKLDIVPILNSSIDLFKVTENIQIKNTTTLKEATIYADKNQLLRVFNNLIKNAIQALSNTDNNLITIHLEEKENQYLFSIKDNGCGIPEHMKAKIFEPNFTTKTSGTGLGLAICKNIIETITGKIWFESVEDEYTIFYIEIPKYEA